MSELNSEAFNAEAEADSATELEAGSFTSLDDHDFIDVLTQSDVSDSDDDDEDDEDDDEFAEDEGETFLNDYSVESIVESSEPTVVMMSLPVTGEPRVDDAIARLSDLSSLPVDEHVSVFEDVQRRLHDTLADLSGQ